MSYGNSPRGSFSGGKGSPAKKSDKRKKQDFHKSKIRDDSEKVDLEEAKARTIISLEHLGKQRLSEEPGGYGLQSWLGNLNVMLDDFQEKLGASRLPPEYYRKRGELTPEILSSSEMTKLDDEIAKTQKDLEAAKTTAKGVPKSSGSRDKAIKHEYQKYSKELAEARKSRRPGHAPKQKGSLLGKILGRSGPEADPLGERIALLETKLKALEEEAARRQDSRTAESKASAETYRNVESLGERLRRLQSERAEAGQMKIVRERLAAEFVEIISKIQVPRIAAEQNPTAGAENV